MANDEISSQKKRKLSSAKDQDEKPPNADNLAQVQSNLYDNQERSSSSQGQPLVKSIEPNDTEPKHFTFNPDIEAKSGSTGQELPSETGHPQRRDDLSSKTSSDNGLDDPECLAKIGSQFDDVDGDHIVDGWGTLRRSAFVILQYGPRHGAKYKAKYKSGYNTSGMNNISDRAERISLLKDDDGRGRKTWRYSKYNVAGIYGVAFEERKNPTKSYKSDPCVWVKIKWKNLRQEDDEKLSRSCSWIPKSDFSRLCGDKDATESKITEVWDKQEQRYLRWLRNEPGRGNDDRSPTPCPLNAYTKEPRERRSTSRLDTPEMRVSSARRNESANPSPTGLTGREGSKSNPVNLDQVENPDLPAFSRSTPAISDSNGNIQTGTKRVQFSKKSSWKIEQKKRTGMAWMKSKEEKSKL
ncbi:hypothetical protein N7510_005193 [Penicillium lagena]|uniref:uncharacterized protein n=1 Tax=Penicillium lagena TaxID=94218 RepID=UPI00253FD7D5|nr:uncharacterized protein N7510_005193 [Penicillium lagena]KAJ5611999.1 hypothetical protein N7510_005193 [Penicillium lagena]